MNLTGSIIIYVLIWWIVFFSLLPVDVDRNQKNFVEGVDPGAPENPKLIKKLFLLCRNTPLHHKYKMSAESPRHKCTFKSFPR